MRRAAAWAAGLAASALLHGVAAMILVPAYAPQERPAQAPPATRLDMETVAAPRQDAALQEPEGETAAERAAQGTTVGAGAVPLSDARPIVAEAQRQTAGSPQAAQATPADPTGTALAASRPAAETVASDAPETQRLTKAALPAAQALAVAQPAPDQLDAAAPASEPARLSTPAADRLTPSRSEATQTAARRPDAMPAPVLVAAAASPAAAVAPATTVSAAALAPPAQDMRPVTATPAALPAAGATGQPAAALAAEGTPLPQARAAVTDAAEAPAPATSAKAALAWQFGDRVVTDPQALATIQAFMEPAALDDAAAVKDDLTSVLTGIDCARLSATFIPETGTLEMRGHIPDPALEGPILAALQARVGEGVPVTANLLHLPAPQCGALTGIANVGLPQSTDQFTNARLVGETAHAREYSYAEGQRLQFDLTAPDYDAFVYVDYFNAEGEVIHLVPNDTIPLEEQPAKSVFGVGKDRPGRPGLRITIGPPFGQEIAVAFASSHRLYDGLRPIVEPAGPYLEELQTLVAEARAAHEDFKGEWVYFFITTAPATQ